MKDSSVENLCSREASGLPSTVPPARVSYRSLKTILIDKTPEGKFRLTITDTIERWHIDEALDEAEGRGYLQSVP